MAVESRDRAGVFVLPSLRPDIAYAPAVLGHNGASVGINRFAGAQVVDSDVDGFRQIFAFRFIIS